MTFKIGTTRFDTQTFVSELQELAVNGDSQLFIYTEEYLKEALVKNKCTFTLVKIYPNYDATNFKEFPCISEFFYSTYQLNDLRLKIQYLYLIKPSIFLNKKVHHMQNPITTSTEESQCTNFYILEKVKYLYRIANECTCK